jgi:hypothetical protein
LRRDPVFLSSASTVPKGERPRTNTQSWRPPQSGSSQSRERRTHIGQLKDSRPGTSYSELFATAYRAHRVEILDGMAQLMEAMRGDITREILNE